MFLLFFKLNYTMKILYFFIKIKLTYLFFASSAKNESSSLPPALYTIDNNVCLKIHPLPLSEIPFIVLSVIILIPNMAIL